jgi:release factor glutamine methyltransferase
VPGGARVRLVRWLLRVAHERLTPRLVECCGLTLWVPRGVFLPRGTVSTGLLARVLEGLLARGRGRLLDVGCGSGALAIYAARMGWESVCYDPSPAARRAAAANAARNGVEARVRVVASPSEALRLGGFEVVVSNPPYLPCEPRDELDTLWCAGGDLRVLREIGSLIRRASRGRVVVALSSLTPPSRGLEALGLAARPAARRRTPLDTVYAYIGPH